MGKLGVVALVLLALVSCTTASVDKALVGSGESLKVVGENYLAVNDVFVAKCPTGEISVATCNTYRVFSPKFRMAYPLAMHLWELGRKAGSHEATDHAESQILGLAAELASIAVKAGLQFSQ